MKWINWGLLTITWNRTPALILIVPVPLTSQEIMQKGLERVNDLLKMGYQITRTFQYETSIFYEMAIDSADLDKWKKKNKS